jgi:catalase
MLACFRPTRRRSKSPAIGGVTADDGTVVAVDQKVGGGPSVLYDAVVVVASDEAVADLVAMPPARDFVADAFAHCKYIGHVPAGRPLLDAAGVSEQMDAGFVALDDDADVDDYVARCRTLRFWDREAGFVW